MENTSPRPGRWRTGEESRRRILEAARSSFGERGYDRTTIRAVASAAGVDPAMVHYFFTNKARLFSLAMELPVDVPQRIAEQLAGGIDGLGERLALHFLRAWDEQASVGPLLALMRSAPTDEASASMFVEFMKREIVSRVGAMIGGDDGTLRAELVASQLMGLAMMRYVVRLEPLASTAAETVAAQVGPALQRYLSGE